MLSGLHGPYCRTRGCASEWERPGSLSVRRIEVLPSGPSRSASGCWGDCGRSIRPKQAVHLFDVGFAQSTRSRLQPQAVQDRVIARPRKIAQGTENLLLGVQDVDVDTHADLVAELVRIERAAAGNERRLQSLYLRHPVGHAKIGLASG